MCFVLNRKRVFLDEVSKCENHAIGVVWIPSSPTGIKRNPDVFKDMGAVLENGATYGVLEPESLHLR